MPAWATREKVGENAPLGTLILPVPDTDFREFLDAVAPPPRRSRSDER